VQARSTRKLDPVGGGRRFLFLAPHGRTTLLGTWYCVPDCREARVEVERGARVLIDEFNEACPGLTLSPADVVRHQWGWLPLKAGVEPGRPDALAERARVLDHGRTGGIRYLYSMEGVKYTTARRVAQQAIDQIFEGLGRKSPPCLTSTTPLDTGRWPDVSYAIREEMAIKLADIVFRRTTLGELPGPDRAAVEAAARMAEVELGWSAGQVEAEIEDVIRQTGIPGAAVEAVG
jgi:glycerol-3-phosphate dehydrogenase